MTAVSLEMSDEPINLWLIKHSAPLRKLVHFTRLLYAQIQNYKKILTCQNKIQMFFLQNIN